MTDAAQMKEFATFLQANGFALPGFFAPLSVYTQFLCGVLLFAGFAVRGASAFVAITFIIGLYGVHWSQTLREWRPAPALCRRAQ